MIFYIIHQSCGFVYSILKKAEDVSSARFLDMEALAQALIVTED